MSSAFTGEIRLFGFNYPPKGWAVCRGQTLSVLQYSALYGLLLNTYGGDIFSFGLPDLRGRVPMGQYQGRGLTNRTIGTQLGTETATGVYPHTHTLTNVSGKVRAYCEEGEEAEETSPEGNTLAKSAGNTYSEEGPNVDMADGTVQVSGTTDSTGSTHANNIPPSLVLNYCICLNGIFPERSEN